MREARARSWRLAQVAAGLGAGLAFGRCGYPWLRAHGYLEQALALACLFLAVLGGYFDEPLRFPPEAPPTGRPRAAAPAAAEPNQPAAPRQLVVVFGATSPTGRWVVTRALTAGKRVRAFALRPSQLEEFKHPDLELVEGSLADAPAVRGAMAGASVALCVAGGAHFWAHYPEGLLRSFIRAALAGAREHGVARLVFQASAFCLIPGQAPSVPKKLVRAAVLRPLGLLAQVEEADCVLEHLHLSALDVSWAATMPSVLRELPSAGRLELKKTFPGMRVVAHEDMATLMLAVAEDNAVRGCMFVGYPDQQNGSPA